MRTYSAPTDTRANIGKKPTNGLSVLFGPGTRRPQRDTEGQPLSELLGRVLAGTLGIEYQPPKVGELEQLLGPENFKILMENPRIKQAVELWANASGEDRSSVVKPMAVLIADEAGQPGLQWRVRQEIGRLK